MIALLSEFRKEFDVPGTRYWEKYPERDVFSTGPGELPPAEFASKGRLVELARHEFLSRQGIYYSYDEDAI